MARVTIYGVCESDKKVIFNKTILLEDEEAKHISGPQHTRIVEKIMKQHFPELKIHPDQVGIQIIYENTNVRPTDVLSTSQRPRPEVLP